MQRFGGAIVGFLWFYLNPNISFDDLLSCAGRIEYQINPAPNVRFG